MADVTVVVSQPTFTVTTPNTQATVVTPTAVEVAIGNPANTIEVATQQPEIVVTPAGLTNTDQLREGTTNLFFTTARARASIQALDTGGLGSLSYNNNSGVITYTGPSASEVRQQLNAGTGITYDNSTGTISVTNPVIHSTYTAVGTSQQQLDNTDALAYRTVKYTISMSYDGAYQAVELLVMHDDVNAYNTVYADIRNAQELAEFHTTLQAGELVLMVSPTNAGTVFKIAKIAIAV